MKKQLFKLKKVPRTETEEGYVTPKAELRKVVIAEPTLEELEEQTRLTNIKIAEAEKKKKLNTSGFKEDLPTEVKPVKEKKKSTQRKNMDVLLGVPYQVAHAL